jgi:hypothetical protein
LASIESFDVGVPESSLLDPNRRSSCSIRSPCAFTNVSNWAVSASLTASACRS